MDLDKFKEGVIWLARMFLHVLNGLGRVVKVLLLINYLSWGLPLITWRIEEEFFSPVSLSCVPFFFIITIFVGFVCLFVFLCSELKMESEHAMLLFLWEILMILFVFSTHAWQCHLACSGQIWGEWGILFSPTLSSLFTLAEPVGIFIFPCSSVLWIKVHLLGLVQLLYCGSLAVWDL